MAEAPTGRVLVDAEGTWCPCVRDHNPNPVEDEWHHLVPLGRPFSGADVARNRRRLCGTAHGSVHALLRITLAARMRGVPVDRAQMAHFSPFQRRLAGVALHAMDAGIDTPTSPDMDWVGLTWRT